MIESQASLCFSHLTQPPIRILALRLAPRSIQRVEHVIPVIPPLDAAQPLEIRLVLLAHNVGRREVRLVQVRRRLRQQRPRRRLAGARHCCLARYFGAPPPRQSQPA